MRWPTPVLPFLAALALAGCAGTLTVSGRITRPAAVPVRAFPHIVVAYADDPESRAMAEHVARHLSRPATRVELRPVRMIGTLRRGPGLGPASVVVGVTVSIQDRDGAEWRRQPEIACGPGGCVETRRPRLVPVTVVEARAGLQVSSGPDGQTLQEAHAEAHERGDDALGARLRVRERLQQRTLALLDQREEPVRVVLLQVSAPPVEAALGHVSRGNWRAARVALEAFIGGPHFAALDTDGRSRVLYNLAQALRFDASAPPARRFEAAVRALREAIQLAPRPRYDAALRALRDHGESLRQVAAQRDAERHNFGLPTAPASVPDGYE